MPDLIKRNSATTHQQSSPPVVKPAQNANRYGYSPTAQQIAQPAQKPSYTVTTTKGKQYTLDGNTTDWIRSRYKSDWAGSYGYDDADQLARKNGQMSAKWRSTYGNSNVDTQLAELGLPSEKNLEKYIAQYDQWHTGTVDQVYKDVPKQQWTKMSEFWKQDYKYEDTTEDQMRRLNGQMPKALESKYTDTELDESLMMRGLPPASELAKYAERYGNYMGINQFYANAAGRWTELRMNNELDENHNYLKNDDTVYTVNGEKVTGRDLFTDAFYDELLRQDETGKYVYSNILPLFKNNHVYEADEKASEDHNIHRGKEVIALGKGENLSDDFENFSAFSFDDFDSKYGDYFSKYYADTQAINFDGTLATYEDGRPVTIADALSAFDKIQTEKERVEFYTIDKLAGDEDSSSVSGFIKRWRNANPTKGYLDMFSDMRANGVDAKNIKAAKDQVLKSAGKIGKDEVKKVKEAWASYNASAPKAERDDSAGGLGGKNYATKEEADAAVAQMIFVDSFDSDMLTRHMDNAGGVDVKNIEEAAQYFTGKGVGVDALSSAMKKAKEAYIANTDEVDEKVIEAFDKTIRKDANEDYAFWKGKYAEYRRDAILAATDESTISNAGQRIEYGVRQLGGKVRPEELYEIIKGTAELPWANKYSVKEALLNLGFTDTGEFNDPEKASAWTEGWTEQDRILFRDMLKKNGYRSVNQIEAKVEEAPEWVEPSADDIALMKDAGKLAGKEMIVDTMYRYIQSHGGWSSDYIKNGLYDYLEGIGLSKFQIAEAKMSLDWRYLRGDYKSLGEVEDYIKSQQLNKDDTLAAGNYQIAKDWMDEVVASGELTPFEAYNVLCGEGLQDEIMAFDEEGWHEAIYKEKIVPEMFNAADGTTKLYWESLSPEDQKAEVDRLWESMTDEQRTEMFADYDWRYDPSIYRTAGQAWSEQLIATLPSVVTNMTSGAVGVADAIASLVSGKEDLWEATRDTAALNQNVASFGAVTDGVNGAQVAQLATDATAELIKMVTLGKIGGSIANKVGGATGLTWLADSPLPPKGVQKMAGMAIDLLKASPFSAMATGNAFAEAKMAGASNAEALPYAFVVGSLEGIIESLNVDKVWGEVMGNGAFGKMLAEGNGLFSAASVVAKARLASIPVAFLGEATEEGLSYLAEAMWKIAATQKGAQWAKDFQFSWKELGEQMLMGGITGALGATLGAPNITKESIMIDYYKNNGKVTAAAVDTDVATNWWKTFNEQRQLTYRLGGWRIMGMTEFADTVNTLQENYRTLHSVDENNPDSIPNMQQAHEKLKANEDAKVNAIERELDGLRGELKGLNPYDAEDAKEFARVSTQIRNKEGALEDAKNKRDKALRASEAAITSKKAQAEEQYSNALLKMDAHFAGIYLRNEDAIKNKDHATIEANMANARVNGDDSTKPGVTSQNASVDGEQAAQYNNNEEANANGNQGTEATGEAGAQLGAEAGVSGPAVTVNNQSGQESGTLRRRNPVLARRNVAEKFREKGLSVVRMVEATPQWFHEAIGNAKQTNSHGAFVTQHELDEYGNMKTFLSPDGSVGVAVTEDGNIVSVFKNTRANKRGKSVSSILFTALDNGGKKLDNFNSPELSNMYLQHGFVPVARTAFVDEFAPDDWNYERDGRPDILFWVHNGDSAETIMEKMGSYEMPDIESIPEFSSYDEAEAARDAYVSENAGWNTGEAQTTEEAVDEGPRDWADYMTTEAILEAARSEDAKDYAHQELAFVVEANNDHVNIPKEELAKHPTIARAEAGAKTFVKSTLEEFGNKPERVALREEIANDVLNNSGSAVFENGKLKKVDGKGDFSGRVAKGHKAAIIMGPPGSGKSSVIVNPLSNQTHSMVLDPDDMKERLPENKGGLNSGRVHDESKLLTQMVFDELTDIDSEHNGKNVIIPKVGSGSGQDILRMAKALKAAGYTVDLYLCNVSDDTSFMRSMARFAIEGRYIDQGFLNSIQGKPLENFKKFAEMTDDNGNPIFDYAEWRDNDVGRGEDSILKWKTGDAWPDSERNAGGGSVEQAGQNGTDVTEQRGRSGEPGVPGSPGANAATSAGAQGKVSKLDAAINGAKLLSDKERAKITDHVKRVGFKGTLSFINDPDQVFDGRIQNGDITLNLAYITPQTAQELKDNPGFWVLKHEFTHYIENSKYYMPFFRAVRSQMIRELGDKGFISASEDYQRAAAEAGHPFKDYSAVVRDMVADYAARNLFTSQEAIDAFVREQDSAASRVYNWLRYVIDRGKLRRQRNAAAIRVLDAERMYAKAFRDANKAPAVDANADYSTPGIDYDLIKSKYGMDEEGNYVGVANPRTGVTAEEDALYMQLVKEGRLAEAGSMVQDLFKRNGWIHGWHGGRSVVGGYTSLNPNAYRKNRSQYFLAKNYDMAQSYGGEKKERITRPIYYGPDNIDLYYIDDVTGEAPRKALIDPVTGKDYISEEEMLSKYIGDINDATGKKLGFASYYVDKNTDEELIGEELENAAPKDVGRKYVLYDMSNGYMQKRTETETAGALARWISDAYDDYDIVENPLRGSIYSLYLNPQNAALHKAYNSVYTGVPDDMLVPDENVYSTVYIHETEGGNEELVVERAVEPGVYQRVPINGVDNDHERRMAFEQVFGVSDTGYRDPYDVFKMHAQNIGSRLQVNDFYIDENGNPMSPYEFAPERSRDIGEHDADLGFDSTVISNVYDYLNTNPYSDSQKPGNVYMARNPYLLKSADAVTYDNKGNVIPLSLRLNTDVNDFRFSTPGLSWDEMVQKYGAKEQGREPRARDVVLPKQVDENRYVSKTTRTVAESSKVSDEYAAEIVQGALDGSDDYTYLRKSNDETMKWARDYIARRQFTDSQRDFHNMVEQGKFNTKTNALGIQLFIEAHERGDVAAQKAILPDLRIASTEEGQSIQILNVLKDMKGVGSAWYLESLIDKLNVIYADEIQSGAMDPITVSEEAMNQVRAAKTQAEVDAAEKVVADEIAPQLPLKRDEKLSNWRYLSMLGNPITHVRNWTGNKLMYGMGGVKDVVAAGVQRLLENTDLVDESDRAHARLSRADKAYWSNFANQSYSEMKSILQGGGKLGFQSLLQQGKRMFDNKFLDAIARGKNPGVMSDKGRVAGLFENIKNNGMMGMLEVADAWGLEDNYTRALMEYMKAQGYSLNNEGKAGKVGKDGIFTEINKEQMNKAIEWAATQAWTNTFRGPSKFATELNKISKMNPVSKLIVEGVMPFKKTPVNIAKQGFWYSPAGAIVGTVELLTKVKQGKMSAATAIDHISSGLTGSALMALGVVLAKAGILRGGGEDKKKYETYLQDTGDQTYAFKFGDASINMSAIAPATIPLFMGAALQEAVASKNGGEGVDLSAITDVLAGTLNPFMEMSFMSSLNSALKNYNNDGIGGALGSTLMTAAQNYGSQYLPTLGGKVAQFIDPTVRSTKSDATSPVGGNLDYYARSLAKKVPGLEATLQPDVDVWGRTNTKDSFGDWALDFANKFILPTNVKVSNRDAVDKELIRVVESTGVTDFLPSDGNKYFTVKGVKYTMNAKQYAQYSQERGQAAYAAIKDVMASSAYVTASDEDKANMLNKAKEAAYKAVNNIWKEKLGAFD